MTTIHLETDLPVEDLARIARETLTDRGFQIDDPPENPMMLGNIRQEGESG